MSEIIISSKGTTDNAETFLVRIEEGDSSTEHEVGIRDDYYKALTNGGISKKELLRRSFAFLLEREPKESILKTFDLSLISTYFPEYERTMKEMV